LDTEPAAATTAGTQALLLDRLDELAAKQDEIRAMLIELQRPPTSSCRRDPGPGGGPAGGMDDRVGSPLAIEALWESSQPYGPMPRRITSSLPRRLMGSRPYMLFLADPGEGAIT
jgi:hypothetical protein